MDEIKQIAEQIGEYEISPTPNPKLIRFRRDDGLLIDIWPQSMAIRVYEKGMPKRYYRDCTLDDFIEFLLSPTTYRVK